MHYVSYLEMKLIIVTYQWLQTKKKKKKISWLDEWTVY